MLERAVIKNAGVEPGNVRTAPDKPGNMVAKLQNYLELHNSSLVKVAKSIALSQTTLNLWVNGKYSGNNSKIETAVGRFLERQDEIAEMRLRKIPFLMLSTAEDVFSIAKDSQVNREIGVLIAEAGCGKTTAIKEYVMQNPEAILIEVDLTFTTKVFFRVLHKRLNLDGVGSIHDLFETALTKLKDSGRLLIIDEAEYLPYKVLELVRRLNDHANIGILLSGMPRLLHNLSGFQGQFKQISSRMGMVKKLSHFTQEDVEIVVGDYFPNSNGIWKEFYKKSNGNGRILEKLMLRCRDVMRINDLTKVEADVIEAVYKSLLVR